MCHYRNAALVASAILALTLGCAEETTEPKSGRPEPVTVAGVIEVPWDIGVLDPGDLTITFADQVVSVASDGSFSISVYPDGPGLLLAADADSGAVLMSVVSGVTPGMTARLDAHTTALALSFYYPGITTSDPGDAALNLLAMESLDEFDDFRDQLEDALTADPLALSREDEVLGRAWWDAVEAFFETFGFTDDVSVDSGSFTPLGEITVDPSFEKGGHRINHLGGSRFEMTNSNGRWAICEPPNSDDSFWVFPNGVLVDWVLKGRPFPPSKRNFDLSVALDDEETVNVYGMGLSPDTDNQWDLLTPREQDLAIRAGVATALLEFVPHVLSTVSNTGRVVESLKVDSKLFSTVGLIMKNVRIVDRLREYIRADNIGGMYWFLTKALLTELSTNGEFRASVASLLGVVITDSAVTRLAASINTKLVHPLLLGNAYTSVLKTVLGLGSSRFKTTFTIAHVVSDFGSITGSVHDEESGSPIEGAFVELLGEVENPLNPALTDVTTSSGAFFFENITTGLKQVRASKEGYLPSTVDVTVRKSETVSAPLIELAQPSGSAFGTIRNDILTSHNIAEDRFQGLITLQAREIGGGTDASFSIYEGDYDVSLPPGDFWLIARHGDYFADSVQVTVRADTPTAAGRDLVMKPRGIVEGEVLIDMDGDGQFETRFDVVDGAASILDPSFSGGMVMAMVGATGSVSSYDSFTLMFDLGAVTGLGAYDLDGASMIGGGQAAAAAIYITSRFQCQPPSGPSQPIGFSTVNYGGNPDQAVCECGVGYLGSVVVDEWGTDLTEAVDAEIFSGELVGYRNCACTCCEDTDGDGDEDDYVAECARARLKLRFRALVGSLPYTGP